MYLYKFATYWHYVIYGLEISPYYNLGFLEIKNIKANLREPFVVMSHNLMFLVASKTLIINHL